MQPNFQEIEVKFYVADLVALEQRVQVLGGALCQERVHETNLRFDTAEGDLKREKKVLRLRQDTASRLTYKGPDDVKGGARARVEIEITVSDFASARAFLEALGYRVIMTYEKFRTVYELDGMEIALDELPYGRFVEIEGKEPQKIQELSERLGLNWEARLSHGYNAMFDRLCERRGLNFVDLSFENFEGLTVTAADLDAQPADSLLNP